MGLFESNRSYRDPKILKKIYDLKIQNVSFLKIAGEIEKEFGMVISPKTIKTLYEEYVAKSLVRADSKEAKDANYIADDFKMRMDERFEKIAKVTDDLMDTMVTLKDRLPPEMYVKYIPTVLAISREILNQLNFVKKEQEQILVQQKNIIYSPLQIMKVINKELDSKIVIAKNGRVLSSEEKSGVVRTEEQVEFDKEEIEAEEKENV